MPGTQTASTATAPGDQGWKRVVPGGDCRCSDGSEFSFWLRKANPRKVVFYLQAGGACFSAKTCAPDSDLYQTRVDESPAGKGGMLDLADERNPFADYSAVYVPYCTGDTHIGDATTKYSPGLTVHHKGYVHGTAALDRLAAAFPRANEVVVVGESAGSVAAPLYAGLVSDRLPDARITVLAHGSGSYPATHQRDHRVLGRRQRTADVARESPPDGQAVELPEAVHPERTARPEDRVRPPRLRLRRGAGELVPARPHPVEEPPIAHRGQRDPDRGRRREPAQLHRAGRRAHSAQRRVVLHRAGQRPPLRRLDDPGHRARAGRRRALPAVPHWLSDLRPKTQTPLLVASAGLTGPPPTPDRARTAPDVAGEQVRDDRQILHRRRPFKSQFELRVAVEPLDRMTRTEPTVHGRRGNAIAGTPAADGGCRTRLRRRACVVGLSNGPGGAVRGASAERQPAVAATLAREPPLSVSPTLRVCATASPRSDSAVLPPSLSCGAAASRLYERGRGVKCAMA